MHAQIAAFLETLTSSENTRLAYQNDLAQFLEFLQQQSPPLTSWQELRTEHVQAFLFFLREREYANSSIARKMAAVRRFCAFLKARGEIPENPAKKVGSPRVEKKPPVVLTREEVEQLLAAAANEPGAKGLRDHAMLQVMYATGVRVSEFVNLRLQDVDLSSCSLRVRSGRHKERVLPLPPAACEAVRRYVEEVRLALVATPDVPALFVNARGSQLTRQGVWLLIREYAEKAGLEKEISPHTLRHTFAVHQMQERTTPQDVGMALGNRTERSLQVYESLDDTSSPELANRPEPDETADA